VAESVGATFEDHVSLVKRDLTCINGKEQAIVIRCFCFVILFIFMTSIDKKVKLRFVKEC
jgi:hypothetical protein